MPEQRFESANSRTPICPVTGVHVLEFPSKSFSVGDWQVTWWNCPACTGWHLLTTKLNQAKDNPPVETIYQPTTL